MKLLKVGGFLMFDNMLWGGRVADDKIREEDPSTKAIYETC